MVTEDAACIICNEAFESRSENHRCCSPECKKVYRSFYDKTPKRKEYSKAYKQTPKYKEYVKQYMREYSKSPVFKAWLKKYMSSSKGKEIKRISNYKRRAAQMNIIETFTSPEWISMKESTKGICPRCKRDVGMNEITLDHIFPLSKANKEFTITGIKRVYSINDIQPLCFECNLKKGNRSSVRYIAELISQEDV